MSTEITPRCHMPWQQMVIDSTGNVAPCCYWGAYDNTNPPIGNLNENTIEQIWNNDRFQRLRQGMAAGDLELAGCARCYAVQQGMALGLEYDPACEDERGIETQYTKNIKVLKREIAEGRTVISAKPTIVSYTPSHRCNIRCTHCYQESTRTSEIVRDRAAEEVVSLAPYLSRIIAGGGEPFLLPIWNEFLAKFDLTKNPYLDFATSTNATIVTDKILAGLSRFKRLTINISLDGTEEVYESVRVGAEFSEVRANIRRLKAVVERAASSSSIIGVSMCVMKSNICDLPNFIRFCAEEGLCFGMSPVITMPPDESLRCFNDPASEMKGWSAAIAEAKAQAEPYRNHFDLLRSQIPFDLADVPHSRVKVSLPTAALQRFSNAYGGQPLVAYIFKFNETIGNAPYWAPIRNGEIEVSLPDGRYCVNISTKWVNAGYWDGVTFRVDDRNQKTILARYRAENASWRGLAGKSAARIGRALSSGLAGG
jgi:radical SAM protein with 4Fe4S-binding SPASM domain